MPDQPFDPALGTALSRVRLALGDTSAPFLVPDETVNAALAAASRESQAIARLARALAVRYAQEPDSLSADGTSISWRERVKGWLAVAAQADAETGMAEAVIAATASLNARRAGDEPMGEYQRPTWWMP